MLEIREKESHLRVSIFGAGYVGLVSGVCLAELGHYVIIVDINANKILNLRKGELPIHEPGLNALFLKNLSTKRLHFTTEASHAVSESDIIFIAVNTPNTEKGEVNLSFVEQAAKNIALAMKSSKTIGIRSTVPPGTSEHVKKIVQKNLKIPLQFDVVSNPEFLREGSALLDFMEPNRIIIGTDNPEALEKMRCLYQPIILKGFPFVAMSSPSAELTKYASNAFLAMKVAFINEISRLSECVDSDIKEIQVALTMDPRIGSQYLDPGCGYGGSCLPKDIQALSKLAKSQNCLTPILDSIHFSNEVQKESLFKKLNHYFEGDLSGRKIAIWGLSFKPNTDDIRSAPSCTLLEKILKNNAIVQAYDPKASENIRKAYSFETKLILCESPYSAIEGADVLVILTEWDEFKQIDFSRVYQLLNFPLVIDGRNMFNPEDWHTHGIIYCGMGRGDPIPIRRKLFA